MFHSSVAAQISLVLKKWALNMSTASSKPDATSGSIHCGDSKNGGGPSEGQHFGKTWNGPSGLVPQTTPDLDPVHFAAGVNFHHDSHHKITVNTHS